MNTRTQWTEKIRDGFAPLQRKSVPRYQATEQFRVYSSTLVPGLLQIEQYAVAVLRIAASFRGRPTSESTDAARARVERSRVIDEPGHQFDFVVEESVLYSRVAADDVMSAQLNHVLAAGDLPGVSIGIIPTATRERVHWTEETFHVFDAKIVTVELVSAELEVTQPDEIALYVRAFDRLGSMAVHGADARALVLRAIEALH
ncbi:DUF5753 domain-containing protein [Streptomyces sp. NPDC091377]|uniref:DUF5753 domain-containing protein n=1 Tax=Streptomyces sp. NPDC091377 TaxID=3365995 RepID=UPI0038234BF0